ncbi:MAG: hypothetical protein F6K17_01375 [Okeania sp. SIO3C4]|nr:hypothetical protein [Okeania sp. SIO3C4]
MSNTILKAEINLLARELASLANWDYPEGFDFFNIDPRDIKQSRHNLYLLQAIRAFEIIQKVDLSDLVCILSDN